MKRRSLNGSLSLNGRGRLEDGVRLSLRLEAADSICGNMGGHSDSLMSLSGSEGGVIGCFLNLGLGHVPGS